ncbi:uncharacterized protein [Ptychodera flava]|uniref:uncharacterized protein n=1 Tax=Ptychodera flava TaxID=63121 RepID=UPI00396A1B2A
MLKAMMPSYLFDSDSEEGDSLFSVDDELSLPQLHHKSHALMMRPRPEFRPFEDYFGLAKIVTNAREAARVWNLEDPLADEEFDVDKLFFSPITRERFDSMGSSGSSVASDFSLNGTDRDFDFTSLGFSDFQVPRLSSPLDLTQNGRSVGLNRRGKQNRKKAGQQVCVFCRNNGESESVYATHALKDNEGKVTCPILRAYTCPICGANGENAHTIKYCPLGKGDEQPSMKLLKSTRTSTGKKRSI